MNIYKTVNNLIYKSFNWKNNKLKIMSCNCGCNAKYCNTCGNYYQASGCPICHKAALVLAGKFGVGNERKRRLGTFFNAVQNEVNRRLGIPYRYPV